MKRDEKDIADMANVPVQKSLSPGSPGIPAGRWSVPSLSQVLQTGFRWCAAATTKLFPANLISTLNIRSPCGPNLQLLELINCYWSKNSQTFYQPSNFVILLVVDLSVVCLPV